MSAESPNPNGVTSYVGWRKAGSGEHDEEDARLIAEAPAMYELLERMTGGATDLGWWAACLDEARALLQRIDSRDRKEG